MTAPTGADLRRRRLAAGWSQQQIANRLDIRQEHVSSAETGRQPVSADVMCRYAVLLDEIEAGT